MGVWLFLYDSMLFLYRLMLNCLAPFHVKARKWVRGRRRIFRLMESKLVSGEPRIWIHCASLGEFEQGRPLIEKLKEFYPGIRILLTFFSPSGYEIRKNYPLADHVFYLPLDSRGHASRFIALTKPKLVVFVKYEFWYHYLHELKAQGIPALLVSARFRRDQFFFHWYGRPFRNLLNYFLRIFVQDQESLVLLQGLGLDQGSLAGDTRFDRVRELASKPPEDERVPRFLEGRQALIAGSTWPRDNRLLERYFREFRPGFPLVLAPHEIREPELLRMERRFGPRTVRYSRPERDRKKDQVLLVDQIGILSSLYRYGLAAYIGGGFGIGIHNILEAAVYGIPVLFGPRYRKFAEAEELVRLGAAFPVRDSADLDRVLRQISQPSNREQYARICRDFMEAGTGATARIMSYIEENRFLTRK